MQRLSHLLENNRQWAKRLKASDPDFFTRLAKQQTPQYLWLGCSDSRVPPNKILDLRPGEIFVHRNIANMVVHTDLNCLSVIEYAVTVLRVKHIIVCGHYGCGGVKAALAGRGQALIDNWLENVREVYRRHRARLEACTDENQKQDRLCELNVVAQVANVCRIPAVQSAWASGRELAVHGWIYGIEDGLLKDLDVSITGPGEVPGGTGEQSPTRP